MDMSHEEGTRVLSLVNTKIAFSGVSLICFRNLYRKLAKVSSPLHQWCSSSLGRFGFGRQGRITTGILIISSLKTTFSCAGQFLMLEEGEISFEVSDGSELSEVSETVQCSICFLEMSDETTIHRLPECGHAFHINCIMQWFRSKQDTCPLCRTHPSVRMKPPDIFQRARQLIDQQKSGQTNDIFVRDRMTEIRDSETRELEHQNHLSQAVRHYKEVLKPRKNEILREYRHLRQRFKEETTPLLKMLDRIDEEDTAVRRRLRKLITMEKKKKRTALRAIGIHNLDVHPQSQQNN